MAFEKGNKLSKGRPIGAMNRTGKEIRTIIVAFLDGNENEFNKRMSLLNDKEYCALYLKMVSMVLPSTKSVYYSTLEPKGIEPIEWINQ
jgi:hypothetical protein